MQPDNRVAIRVTTAIYNMNCVGDFGGAFIIFQNNNNFRTYAKGIAILLGGIALRRNNRSTIATYRQHKLGIAVFIGTHKAVAYGNDGIGHGQAIMILHVDGVGDFLFLIQPHHNILVGILGCQQILGAIRSKSIRKNQLHHVATLGQLRGNDALFIGDQNHRLAVDRESGGDAGHRQAFHVLKS